jgi:hypothetical protein
MVKIPRMFNGSFIGDWFGRAYINGLFYLVFVRRLKNPFSNKLYFFSFYRTY